MKLKLAILSLAFCAIAFADQALTNARIVELAHSGITAGELQRLIETAPSVNFLLTPAATDALLQAGISEDTIKAMAARENGLVAITNVAPIPKAIAPGSPSTQMQTKPFGSRVDVFTGFSYVAANVEKDFFGLYGFEGSASVNITRFFAVEGAFGSYFGSGLHDISVMGGPRLNLGQGLFLHALTGIDQASAGNVVGFTVGSSGFAGAFGGGFQSRSLANHVAFRTSFDYVLIDHSALPLTNNFRVSTGIVFTLGSRQSRF